jgi:hypothetical protein
MPTDVRLLTREHVETFMVQQVERFRPKTAQIRYGDLQQFFKWAVEEREVTSSPMGPYATASCQVQRRDDPPSIRGVGNHWASRARLVGAVGSCRFRSRRVRGATRISTGLVLCRPCGRYRRASRDRCEPRLLVLTTATISRHSGHVGSPDPMGYSTTSLLV